MVTFGSFNALPKLSDETIAAWAALLARMPGSRLVLKATALQSDWARDRLLERFAAAGVGPDRLDLLRPTRGTLEHLAMYARVGIALDPFPYNGTTTTCEALWMGVPVVTLAGHSHAGRVGVSLLTAAGLPELIADSTGDYVEIAAGLARDETRLASLRAGLRARMGASVLCDGPAYARRFETALRGLWREWCAGEGRR